MLKQNASLEQKTLSGKLTFLREWDGTVVVSEADNSGK